MQNMLTSANSVNNSVTLGAGVPEYFVFGGAVRWLARQSIGLGWAGQSRVRV